MMILSRTVSRHVPVDIDEAEGIDKSDKHLIARDARVLAAREYMYNPSIVDKA